MKNIGLDIRLDEQEFTFMTGCRFRGLTISMCPEGWNVVLRGFTLHDDPVVAFGREAEVQAAVEGLIAALSARGGAKLWRHDRYSK